MSKRADERRIFSHFVDTEPRFASEPIRRWWQPRTDPPDFLCVTASGRRIGVELVGWLDQRQMGYSKRAEQLGASLARAIGWRRNRFKNVGLVWLSPQPWIRQVEDADTRRFRASIFDLIADTDQRWPSERWGATRGCTRQDLARFPPLESYLKSVRLFPSNTLTRPWPRGVQWVTLPPRVSAFSEQAMLPPLYRVLDSKRERTAYRALRTKQDLADLDLIVHYDQALIHNTPVFTPRFTLQDAAAHARGHLAGDPGPFARIFVFKALSPGTEVICIFP